MPLMNQSRYIVESITQFLDELHLGKIARVIARRGRATKFLIFYKMGFFLWRLRLSFSFTSQHTSSDELRRFLKRIKLKSSEHELCRLGPIDDGGYIVPNDFEGVVANFSPGVGPVVGFEVELAKMGIESYMIDASVGGPPVSNSKFHFEKKYLGAHSHGNFISLSDWVTAYESTHLAQGDYILSMDIEGAEYDVLANLDERILAKFRIVVVEFHNLHQVYQAVFYQQLVLIFDKLLLQYDIVNMHANNNAPIVKYKNIKIPPVIEFTFLRKDRIKGISRAVKPNLKLNAKNNKSLPDVTLPAIWYD